MRLFVRSAGLPSIGKRTSRKRQRIWKKARLPPKQTENPLLSDRTERFPIRSRLPLRIPNKVRRGGGYFYSPQPNPYGGAYNGGSRQNAYGEQQRKSSKSKIAAGLLGIFLGSIGVHNFYLGRTGRGIAQIVATICTCGIAGIWGFIEGILCLCGNYTDADGLPLSD